MFLPFLKSLREKRLAVYLLELYLNYLASKLLSKFKPFLTVITKKAKINNFSDFHLGVSFPSASP